MTFIEAVSLAKALLAAELARMEREDEAYPGVAAPGFIRRMRERMTVYRDLLVRQGDYTLTDIEVMAEALSGRADKLALAEKLLLRNPECATADVRADVDERASCLGAAALLRERVCVDVR